MYWDDYDSEEQKFLYERRHEETHYSLFFKAAHQSILREFNIPETKVVKEIDAMTKIYEYPSKDRFTKFEFNKFENLCAYFYRFGRLSACLTRYRIAEAVKNCDVFRSYLQNLSGYKNRVMSLGGGPGCEIIGFCSGVEGIIDCEELDLTVVDNVEGWGVFFNLMVNMARDGSGNYSYSPFRFQEMFKKMKISASFIWKDVSLVDETNESYLKTLKKADVVVMKSLLCVLTKASAFTVATNVVLEMKEGAVLLFLDEVDFDFCQLGMERIYSSLDESEQTANSAYFKERTHESYGRKSAPFMNEELTVYVKRFQ